MPVLLALVGLVSAVFYFILRARNAANAATDLFDMANDVRLAARRFGFKRQTNLHPAEAIEDPNIAIAGIANAFIELDDLPTSNHRTTLNTQMKSALDISQQDAEELSILGRWLTVECGSPDATIARLSRKLFRLSGAASFAPLLTVLQGTLAANTGAISTKQKEALDDIKRAFKIT